jgi:dTDP-4-amino-4,6-dideoxy-D-galactose acyltransferase
MIAPATVRHTSLTNLSTPYRFYRDRIGAARYDDWAARRAAGVLSTATGHFELDSAAIAWNRLAWDTQMFGFPAARIELFAGETRAVARLVLEHTLEDCRRQDIRHLIARIDASALVLAAALSDAGFDLIDGIQTFSLLLEGETTRLPLGTKLARPSDADEVAAIARDAFRFDRFHADEGLTPAIADRVNETWARNSVLGEAADAVLLSSGAFVSCKVDHASKEALGLRFASIPLVATALSRRGKGAARLATEAAIAWCGQQRVDVIEVGTQLANIPAARLYESAGFRTTALSLTYRKLM